MGHKNYLDLLDELRAIAQLGLNYTKDPFDRQRYDKLLELAAGGYSEITGLPSGQIRQRFARELGQITPKIGVNGALFDRRGRILLDHRSDDQLWGLPGGWVDVGEDPRSALTREFSEEADLAIEPVGIINFYTRLPGLFNQPHTSVHILYYCKWISGVIKKSHESIELNFLDYKTVANWHKDHQMQAAEAAGYHQQLEAGKSGKRSQR